jgi:hypothetical protein
MIDKKKLKQEYKNRVPEKGIYAITNTKTGRTFLGSTLNLYNIVERSKLRLNTGSHQNERLRKDWKIYGEEAFSFQILETLKLKDDLAYDYDEDLQILEMIWIDKYRPFAEKCYNENEKIRTV